jgi:hypothetical protein
VGANVPYPTDPRLYGLDALERDIPDEEFEREYLHCVHAYRVVDHAIDAMYRCGLEPVGSSLKVFVRKGDAWVFDAAATQEVIADM